MRQDRVKFIQNYFFEAFVLKQPDFGFLALGYFTPFKEIPYLPELQQEEVLIWLKDLFTSCDVVGGDLNSTPGVVAKVLDQLKLQARWADTPTYLFSAPNLSEEARVPCFDNCILFNQTVSDYSLEPLIKLPETVSRNPRELMKELNSPSDHVPVICRLGKNKNNLKIGFYNVADPLLWGKFYPTAADGFELNPESEKERLQKLRGYIKTLLEKTEVLGLVEIPTSLKPWLIEQAENYSREIVFQSMVETEKDSRGFRRISPSQPVNSSLLALVY